MTRPRPLADRFWPKVNKEGPVPAHRPELGPCWLWTSTRDTTGYGTLSAVLIPGQKKRMVRASRISWVIHFGVIPDGLWVLHHCDVRLCVRPDHLWLGTVADNAADMKVKGRARGKVMYGEENPSRRYPWKYRGERSYRARFTSEQVREVRRLHQEGVSCAEIGRMMGASRATTWKIVAGLTWKHLLAE